MRGKTSDAGPLLFNKKKQTRNNTNCYRSPFLKCHTAEEGKGKKKEKEKHIEKEAAKRQRPLG